MKRIVTDWEKPNDTSFLSVEIRIIREYLRSKKSVKIVTISMSSVQNDINFSSLSPR